MPAVGRRCPLPYHTAALVAFPVEFDYYIRQAQPTDMTASGYGYRILVWADGGQGPGTEAEVFRYFALWLPQAQAPQWPVGTHIKATFEVIP